MSLSAQARAAANAGPPSQTAPGRMLGGLGLQPRKGLGQHFLVAQSVLERIADAADIAPGDTVVEVGPGLGALTEALARRAGRVVALELDTATLQGAAGALRRPPHTCRSMHADALKAPLESLVPAEQPYKMVANLPYYAATAIIRRFLEAAHKPTVIVATVQREVAQGMAAPEGKRGLLGVATQFYGSPRIVTLVRPGSFHPPPKVTSAVRPHRRPPFAARRRAVGGGRLLRPGPSRLCRPPQAASRGAQQRAAPPRRRGRGCAGGLRHRPNAPGGDAVDGGVGCAHPDGIGGWMEPLSRRAYAKLNLGLEVLARRDDGYHELVTVFQTVSLADEVTASPAASLTIRCKNPALTGRRNLVWLAADLLQEGSGSEQGATIGLVKAIPVSAGLGGGSSDAAAALALLDQLWELDWPEERLAEAAGRLGSDVPFFLRGGASLARGRGELLEPLPTPLDQWFLLLMPNIRMPGKTPTLYRRLRPADFTDGSATEALAESLRAGAPLEEASMVNTFERAATETFEGLDRFRTALEGAAGHPAHLSGSGPSLFARVDGHEAGAEGLESLRKLGFKAALVRAVGDGEQE